MLAGLREPSRNVLTPLVVEADNGAALLRHAGDQALLYCGIVFHRAMPIEMVLGEVDQDPDRWIERRRKIDLIGRALDYVRAIRTRRRQGENGGANVAAELRIHAR